MNFTLTIIGIVALVLLVLAVTFISRYITVAPDQAMIVTGSYLGSKNTAEVGGRKVKILTGGGAFILPIFQQKKVISLGSVKLPTQGNNVYTLNGVPITVQANAIIKIGNTISEIATAAEQFPNGVQEMSEQSKEVLEGHLRAILGEMSVEEVYKDRQKFSQNVQKIASADLVKMGLQIISFTISEVKDANGYLDALGKPRIAQIKRDAEIAEAEAVKESSIKKAQAEEQSEKARILKDTNVAEATKDMELKKAAYKREQDKSKAEADISYEIQEAISKREVVEAEMDVQKLAKDREIELQEKEIERTKKELEATVKNTADADLYQRQKAAEASRFEEEQRAKAQANAAIERARADSEGEKARADAEAGAERAKGLAAADVQRATGEAEADAEKSKTDILRATGEAEAKAERARIDNLEAAGLAEAKAIEAKGLAEVQISREKAEIEVTREMGLAEAALKAGELKSIELITAVLPQIAAQIAAPLGNVDKITIVDTGNGEGMGKLTNTVTNVMHTLPDIVENMTGVNLGDLLSNITKGRVSASPSELTDIIEQVKQDPALMAKMFQVMQQHQASTEEK